jgi:hypothetical protein
LPQEEEPTIVLVFVEAQVGQPQAQVVEAQVA